MAKGSGLLECRVVPAPRNAPALRTSEGTWATVMLVRDQAQGQVFGRDDYEGRRRQEAQYRSALFSVQFFSEPNGGAIDHAARLCLWAGSDDALTSAEGGVDPPMLGSEPAWTGRPEMRLDLPLSYDQISDIDDEAWEERAVINMRCHYVAQYLAEDWVLTEHDVTVVSDGGPTIVVEPPT